MRILAPSIGAVPAAFSRVLLAMIGLAAILALLGIRWRFDGRLKATLFLGVINSGIPFLMYSIAARLLPAGYSAIFNATTPLMGVLIGLMFFSERPTTANLVGVLLGICGVAVLTLTGPIAFTPAVALGALACLAATGCYGTAGFLTKRWITDRGPLDAKLVAFGSQIGAALFLLPFFAGSVALTPLAVPEAPSVWVAMAALGLVCTACAYVLYFRLIADIGPVRSFTVTFLAPPFGVLWGALLLGEQLSWAHACGGGLIFLALVLVLNKKKTAPSPSSVAVNAEPMRR
jgi:drug/metabolite transporter (DMT)-like permease